jgi:hypothetical protein
MSAGIYARLGEQMWPTAAAHINGRPWAQTVTGRAVPLIDVSPDDIDWIDVCYGLAHQIRYAGHAGVYTVAQHSIFAEAELMPDWRPYWLLHDAHEAYIGDITRPVQKALAAHAGDLRDQLAVRRSFDLLKQDFDRAIYTKAGLIWPIPPDIAEAIHLVDARMLMTEVRDLMAPKPMAWGYENFTPYHRVIVPWRDPEYCYTAFAVALKRHFGLTLPPMSNIEKIVDQQ